MRGKQPTDGMISWDEAWPVINRLIEHCGSKAEVVRRLGRHGNWLYEIRKYPSIRRAHFLEAQKLLNEIEVFVRQNGVGEAEVVRAEPLSTILRGWVVEWLAERPINHNPMGVQRNQLGDEDVFMGPIQYLAERSEINPRRVSGIVNGEFDHVSLTQADKLLTAAGLGHLISWGDIPIIPNPHWSMEKWQEYMESRGCA